MSDRPIQVGDLVMVVKPGCSHINVGHLYVVAGFDSNPLPCSACGHHHGYGRAVMGGQEWHFKESRLRRIPPLSELEGERTEENMKEPA